MGRQKFDRFTSLTDLLHGQQIHSSRQSYKSPATRGRRLGFEVCEQRAMLSGASIGGVKYDTANAIGYSAADVPMGGVTIQLYQDTGNGVFDAADTLAATKVTTPGTGAYKFTNVADGHYYLKEIVPTNYTQSAGPAYYTLDVIGGVVYADVLNVDNFDDPDPADIYFISAINPNPTVISTTGVGIIGGHRDTTIQVLGLANPISANGFVGTTGGQGVFNLGTGGFGPATEVTLNYNGTGLPVDLTSGGTNNGLRFDFNFLQVGVGTTMDMDIMATSSGGTATFSTSVTANNGPFINFVSLASFLTSGSFSFADVTNLQVRFNHSGVQDVDFELNQILGVRQDNCGYNFGNFPNPSCVSGYVYVDSNRNCRKDPGEPPIQGVIITIQGKNDLGQTICLTTTTDCNGGYKFGALRPGCYTITESQPINFIDGKAQIGSQGGSVISTNVLKANLGPGVGGTNNNFGEVGLTMAYVSKKYFIDPKKPVCLTAVYCTPPAPPTAPSNNTLSSISSTSSTSGAKTTAKTTTVTTTTTTKTTPAASNPFAAIKALLLRGR